jgi:hypothetical protein
MWKGNYSLTVSIETEESSGHGRNMGFKRLYTKGQYILHSVPTSSINIAYIMSKSKKTVTVYINATMRCVCATIVA